MTRNEDIERVLDRFYAEGPSEMPDRLFLSVVDQIERVPQRRLADQMTRFAIMSPRFRLAAAAAIVVAVVGVGAYAFTRTPNVASQPTPGASQVASPTPGAGGSAPLPVALQGRWVGAPRVVPEAPEPPYRNALLLTDVQAGFALVGQSNQQEFASIATLAAPDQLNLRGASTDGGCKPRDEGTYTFNLDASGTALTLTPIADACGPRATALTGDWVRVGCAVNQGWCLGDLPAGTHASTLFTPFVVPSAWTYAYGKFTYTTPAGWTNGDDSAGTYSLAKQAAPANTAIFIWSDVVPHGQAQQCSPAPEAGVGRTANAIATWLTTLPGLVASAPSPVTIGGLRGQQVDLSVAPTWKTSCPYAYAPGLPLVATLTSPTADGVDWNIQGQGRTRIIALDLPDGRSLVIDIEGQTKADYDALLPDAMQVVNTFQFLH